MITASGPYRSDAVGHSGVSAVDILAGVKSLGDSPPANSNERDSARPAPRPPVNILLVDDHPSKLLSYEVILASLGERLIRAHSGMEALEILLRTEVAVVLVDVCMPGIDGFELSAMIREHPRLNKTSIILVSGVMVEDDARLKGYDSGAVDYVSVPIIPAILRAKVAVFADLFRKTAELERLNRDLERRVSERTAEISRLLAQAEQARREAETANKLKDEFLATVSHELRTPLHAISGWVEILKIRDVDDAVRAKALEIIGRNAHLQGRLIAEILDVSRIITGKLRLDLQAINLLTAAHSAMDTLRPAAAEKGVELIMEPWSGPAVMSGDVERLQQVIWNLVANAIKFSPTGGQVRVGLSAVGNEFRLDVIDDGQGITPEFLPYIFERFRQADSSSTRVHQGLGLGLAIVRHLVEMHGGRVMAANRGERSGACFSVFLPRGNETDDSVVTEIEGLGNAHWQAAGSLHGRRVLVVDDDADGREAIAALLETWGAEVKVASCAAEARLLVARERPDVLLADIEMPEEDGYEMLRKLRALSPEDGGQVPSIALTAYAGAKDRKAALRAGFQMHLAKPVKASALFAALLSQVGGEKKEH